MYGNPYFGMNNAMPMNTVKQGMYGQNAMQLPGAYGGDPYSVVGGGGMGYGGYPQGYMGQPAQLGFQQQPLMRNRGMRPFRGQNALNSMYGQMPSPYASVE